MGLKYQGDLDEAQMLINLFDFSWLWLHTHTACVFLTQTEELFLKKRRSKVGFYTGQRGMKQNNESNNCNEWTWFWGVCVQVLTGKPSYCIWVLHPLPLESISVNDVDTLLQDSLNHTRCRCLAAWQGFPGRARWANHAKAWMSGRGTEWKISFPWPPPTILHLCYPLSNSPFRGYSCLEGKEPRRPQARRHRSETGRRGAGWRSSF